MLHALLPMSLGPPSLRISRYSAPTQRASAIGDSRGAGEAPPSWFQLAAAARAGCFAARSAASVPPPPPRDDKGVADDQEDLPAAPKAEPRFGQGRNLERQAAAATSAFRLAACHSASGPAFADPFTAAAGGRLVSSTASVPHFSGTGEQRGHPDRTFLIDGPS